MDRGSWWATVHGTAESDMTKQPSMRKCLQYVHVGSAEEGAVVLSLSGTDVNGER